MGWARGSEIADTIWELVSSHIPASEKKNIAIQLIDIFEMEDADDFNGEMEICKDADMYQDEE